MFIIYRRRADQIFRYSICAYDTKNCYLYWPLFDNDIVEKQTCPINFHRTCITFSFSCFQFISALVAIRYNWNVTRMYHKVGIITPSKPFAFRQQVYAHLFATILFEG